MRSSRKVRLGFGLALLSMALYFVTLTIHGTWEAGDYFRRTYPSLPAGRYPVVSVAGFCVLILGEALVLWRLLAGPSISIGRALAALGLSLGGAGALFVTLMAPDHVPARVTCHFLWLLAAAAVSMGTVLTLAVAHLARFLAGSRQRSGSGQAAPAAEVSYRSIDMAGAKKFTLSEEMERKISALWSSERDRGRVRDALGSYAAEEFGSERVPLAILKLCRGDVKRVLSLTAEARLDFRDVLMAAEYPEQGDAVLAAMGPRATDADRARLEEAAQRDREQYEEWRKK